MQRFRDRFGHVIELTTERWHHVLLRHPELNAVPEHLGHTVQAPDVIRRSIHDPHVWLYYQSSTAWWTGKYVVVVVKLEERPARRFILTAYLTDRIKGGIPLWPNA